MERESFEDETVAAMLNEHFVAIKVDREERPDIDHIYMTVCQAMTGQGGWPLTVVLTPDKKPFFAGTYFPKERRYGRMGLLEILEQLAQKWATEHDKLVEASAGIVDELRPALTASTRGEVQGAWLEDAFVAFRDEFDQTFGGFGDAPKFPTPHNLVFLLRYGVLKQQPEAIRMVEKTLRGMMQGGIYDHVGFGFARYATDREWLVPHFEKMMYDNALICLALIEAYQWVGDPAYADTARDVLTYVLRDMTDDAGGFYSAEDADSEGEEGKFYLWDVDEVVGVLGPELGSRYCRFYDITPDGNFEGRNIPNLIHRSVTAFCAKEGISEAQWAQDVRRANKALFERRERRIHPHKDDKVLTGWNGLMMAAMARAGRVLGHPAFTHAAEKALEFVENSVTTSNGRLLARYRDGHAAHLGYVDDYAFLIWACIELYEATFEARYLKKAVALQADMTRLFWDDVDGGFFFYGSDAEELIVRPKEVYDGATPSGNSVAAMNLVRLARFTGDTAYEERASRLFEAFADSVDRYPMGYTQYLSALQFAVGPTKEIVVAGDPDRADVREAASTLQKLYLPDAVLMFHPDGKAGEGIEAVSGFIAAQKSADGTPTVYICENFACRTPITDVNEAITALTRSRELK